MHFCSQKKPDKWYCILRDRGTVWMCFNSLPTKSTYAYCNYMYLYVYEYCALVNVYCKLDDTLVM